MTTHDLSRRAVMRGALKAGAYSAPLSTGSVTFAPFGSGYLGQGNGASPNTPFLFVLSDPDGNVLANKVVATDGAGRFTVTISPSGRSVGSAAAPAIVNGGNIFVDLGSTFGGMATPVPFPTATLTTTSQAPPTIPAGTPVPTPTLGRNGCLPGQVCDPTALAQTTVALTATARAKGP